MALKFVFGKMGANVNDYIFDICFKEAQNEDTKPIYIIVSEKYTYEMEKKLAKYFEEKKYTDSNFRIRVLSLSTLMKLTFTHVGALKMEKIDKSVKNIITFKAIEKLKDLEFFKSTNYKNGFVNEISDIISDFKKNNLSKEELKDIEKKLSGSLKAKFSDLIKIYLSYEDLIKNKYFDTEDIYTIFKEKIDCFDNIKDSSIFLLGYTDFTLSQLEIIEKLIVYSKNIYVTLMTDLKNLNSNLSVFSKANRTYITLREIATKNKVKVLENKFISNDDYYINNSLLHLEKNILKFKPLIFTKDFSNIKAFSFKNSFKEISFVANEIIKLTKINNLRYNEITVLLRDLEDYDYIIKRVFEDYNIKYFLDEKVKAINNPVVVLILSILEMKINNYSYNSVFRYLKTYLTGISKDEIYILENYVLENGIKNKAFFDEKYKKISHKFTDEDEKILLELDKINEIKDKVFLPIKNFDKKLKKKNTVKEIATYLYEFTEQINLFSRVNEYIAEFKEKGDFYKEREYSQIYSSFISILEKMVSFMEDEKISLKNFFNILKEQFENLNLGIIPPCKDEVFVTTTERMQKENQKVVFVIGFNDDKFPKNINQKSLISQSEKDILEKEKIKFTDNNFSKIIDEQLYIYKALSFAKERLYLTFPTTDLLGNVKRPSTVLKKIKNIFKDFFFTNFEKEENFNVKNILNAFSNEYLYKIYIYNIKNFKDDTLSFEEKKILLEIEEFLTSKDEYKNKIFILKNSIRYKNDTENIKEFTESLYSSEYFSLSKLESFASCPFSYFLKYGLNVKEREIYDFTSLDYGNYCHKVLDSFFKNILQKNINFKEIKDDYIEKEINEITKKIIDSSYILESSKKYKYFSNILKLNLKESISVMIESLKRGNFIPFGFEEDFSKDSKIKPIVLDINENKKIKLIGKIDRFDILKMGNKEYLKVIDYKSSSKDIDLNMVYKGLGMQLFIYMNALLKNRKNLIPGAVLYSNFTFEKIKFDYLSEFFSLDKELFFEKILNENKLSGFVLKDLDLISNLDNTLDENNQKSSILPITLKSKAKEISSFTKAFTQQEFEIINKFVLNKAKEIVEKIYLGDVKIFPYKYLEKKPCDFCKYKSICKFDSKCDKYNFIKKLSKDNLEVLEKMKEDLKKERL